MKTNKELNELAHTDKVRWLGFKWGYENCREDIIKLINGHKKCMNELCYKELIAMIEGK